MEVAKPPFVSLANLEVPHTGVLSPSSMTALTSFMEFLKKLVSSDVMPDGYDFHCGAYEVVREEGVLKLQTLFKPVFEEPDEPDETDPRDQVSFQKTHLFAAQLCFAQHSESLKALIWEVMLASGQVDYLKKCADVDEVINKDWRVVISVNPYFGRAAENALLHKDTPGNLLFFSLLYGNDQEMPGPEYVLRPPLGDEHEETLEKNLPPYFLDAVREQLKQPQDYTIHVAWIKKNGFVSILDEGVVHSTPFSHHRGCYSAALVLQLVDERAPAYFYPAKQSKWRMKRPKGKMADVHEVAQGIEKLRARAGESAYLEPDDVLAYFPDQDFRDYLFYNDPGIDPFQYAVVNTDKQRTVAVTDDRTRKLTRELSEKLKSGETVTRPSSIDFLRIWVMAERRSPAGH